SFSSNARPLQDLSSNSSALRNSADDGRSVSSKSSAIRSSDIGLPAASKKASSSEARSLGSERFKPGYLMLFGSGANVDRREGFILHQLDQRFLDQLEHGHEGDDHAETPLFNAEQRDEGNETAALEALQHVAHALAGRQCLARDLMALEHVGPPQHLGHGEQQLFQADLRQQLACPCFGRFEAWDVEVAPYPRQLVEVLRGRLEALVLLQPANQFGARVALILLRLGRTRQQHARLDLGQHRRHHQVFGSQLQAYRLHQLDISHVLAGDFRHGNVEDVDVLLADQVQQQVERTFEGLEENLQRIRRDVQVQRQLVEGFTVDQRQPQLLA